MATLAEMFTPLSKDDVMQGILDVAAAVGLPTEAWQPGEPGREVLEVCAQKIADQTLTTAAIAAGGLLDYAVTLDNPGWITLLAKSGFGVDRILATFGSTSVILTDASGVSYSVAAEDFHFVNSTTGKTYTNTTGGSLSSGGGTLTVMVKADESGTGSNASPGDISELLTPLSGVTMTNPAALVATDDETPVNLAKRCRAKLAAASPNGPRDAYDYFALSAVRTTGDNVGVTRTKLVQSLGSNILYVATSSGSVTGTAGDPTTDLGAVNVSIQNSCVPTGITCTVVSATPLTITVSGDVYLKSGSTASAATVKAAVLAQLSSYFATIPIGGFDIGAGGFVFLDALIGQVYNSHPDIIQFTVVTPAVDTAVGIGQVPTLTSVSGSFTIHST